MNITENCKVMRQSDMPVRLLNSAVFKWPDKQRVLNEAKLCEKSIGSRDKNIVKILCFGSICKGTWGVGSDPDILIILDKTTVPFISRACPYDTSAISVPTDILVYTQSEITIFALEKRRSLAQIEKNGVLLYMKNT